MGNGRKIGAYYGCFVSVLLTLSTSPQVRGFQLLSFSSAWSSAAHIVEHIASPPSRSEITLDDVANVRIPGPPGSDVDIAAYQAIPQSESSTKRWGRNSSSRPAILLIHEFFGLNPSIAEKAQGLADDLGCVVIAPDTFRGEMTEFVPKAIWLALTTPQDRVNSDLDAVCEYLTSSGVADPNGAGLAVMGFCYGGGRRLGTRWAGGRTLHR